jgi:molybdopterin synthase sulfur carrier subunit
MVTVNFLGPIEKDGMQLNVNSIAELKEELNRDSSMQKWLSNSAVALNDEIITEIDTKLKDGDIISILPPVCGG